MADGERLCRAALALTPGFFSISHGAVDTEHAALLERALARLGELPRTPESRRQTVTLARSAY